MARFTGPVLVDTNGHQAHRVLAWKLLASGYAVETSWFAEVRTNFPPSTSLLTCRSRVSLTVFRDRPVRTSVARDALEAVAKQLEAAAQRQLPFADLALIPLSRR